MDVLTQLGVAFHPGQFADEDKAHQFNDYMEVLAGLSNAPDYNHHDFFLDLLKTPIALRPAYVFGLGNQLAAQRRIDFFYLFSAANSLLKSFL